MKADYTTYQTAAARAMLGLVIQSVAALGLLLYSVYAGRDHATGTASIFVALGVLVWLGLVIYFDFGRRERIEAMEAEALAAADAASSSAFEQSGDELRVAQRRLRGYERFALPVLGGVFGVALLGVGIARLTTGLGLATPPADAPIDPFLAISERQSPLPAIGISLAIAVVGFIFARYVSGMAKQPAWSALRAGASATVGASLVAVLLVVAYALKLANVSEWLLRFTIVIIPGLMILLGGEALLNLVFQLYSPRKPGEGVRTAFELRSLGLVAAPDRVAQSIGEALNYQFGVDVSETWFYKLIQRWWAALAVFGVLVGWGLTSVVVVQPHQQSLILANGRIDRVAGPGLHVKLPWPFGEAVVPEHRFTVTEQGPRGPVSREETIRTTSGLRQVDLGTSRSTVQGALLWTKAHGGEERFTIVRPSPTADRRPASGSADGSGGGDGSDEAVDLALIAVEVPLQFSVTDVRAYSQLAAPGQEEKLFRSIGQRAINRYLSTLTIDEIMSSRREQLAASLRAAVERDLRELIGGVEAAGITIRFVGAEGVHPPQKAAGSFEQVVEAKQTMEAVIEDARQYEVTTLSAVAGSAARAKQIADEIAALDAVKARGGVTGAEVAAQEARLEELIQRSGGVSGELLLAAQAERWEKHMAERGRSMLFAGQATAFAANPGLYRAERYSGSLRSTLQGARVYFVAGGVDELRVELDVQTTRSTADVLAGQAAAEGQ